MKLGTMSLTCFTRPEHIRCVHLHAHSQTQVTLPRCSCDTRCTQCIRADATRVIFNHCGQCASLRGGWLHESDACSRRSVQRPQHVKDVHRRAQHLLRILRKGWVQCGGMGGQGTIETINYSKNVLAKTRIELVTFGL